MWLWAGVVVRAQEVGTTEVVYDYVDLPGPDTATAINASIVAAEGQLWIAAEWYEDGAATSLDLHWFNGTSWARKTLATEVLTSTFGEDDDQQLMYPSISTWQYSPYVYVIGKQNNTPSTGTEPHLTSFRQDRDNLAMAAGQTDVAPATPTTSGHGRAHLTADFEENDAQFVCWVSKQQSEALPDDDLQHKGKSDTEPWGNAGAYALSIQEDIVDDHCQQSVDGEGYIWTSYHSDPLGDDEIYLKRNEFDVTTGTWSGIAAFQLGWGGTGWENADFPSSSTGEVIYGPDVRMVVAQQVPNPANSFIWWRCEGGAADCDTSGEWTVGVFDPPNSISTVSQPMVFVDALFGDAFVLWESAGGAGNIGLAKWCAGDTGWTEVGVIDNHVDHSTNLNHQWGEFAGSPLPVLATDWLEFKLHAVFLASPNGVATTRNNLMHWSKGIWDADMCL